VDELKLITSGRIGLYDLRYHVQRNVDELKHDVVLDDAHGRVDGYHVQRNVDELKPLLAGTCRPPCDVTTFNGTWTN